MIKRIGINNRLDARYLTKLPTNDVREVESTAKKYAAIAKTMTFLTVLSSIAIILILGYIAYRYNLTRAAIALGIAIATAVIMYHASGMIYSIKPFYKHLYKDA